MLERAEELKQRVRETPLNDRLDDARRRIGKMCSEGRPPRMTIPVQYDDDDFYISTTLADAQATIADLQGQIAVERANKESAVACVDRDVKKISALQQRVAQLEGEKQEYMQAATNEPLNEPLTYGALKAARFVAKRAFQELVKARADHARVLGLVQEREYEIKRRIWQMHGSRMGHQLYGDDGRLDCNTCFRKYSDESLETVYGFELYDAKVLCAKAASLPAQPAQTELSQLQALVSGMKSIIPHQHCRTCNQYADELRNYDIWGKRTEAAQEGGSDGCKRKR